MRLILLALLTVMMVGAARASSVDTALVLAIDTSASIDNDEWSLQVEGTAAALESDELATILQRSQGVIAVTVVLWSGEADTAISWTHIQSSTDLRVLAQRVRTMKRERSDWTAIGTAIEHSVALIQACPWTAIRRVIDVSGDGINNHGPPPLAARAMAAAADIQINGLPILTEDATLETYYRDNVIGGPGAFIVPAMNSADFGRAMLRKLTMEIM